MKKKFPFILAFIFIVIIGVVCIFISSNIKRQNTLSDNNIEEQKIDDNYINNESTTTTDAKVEDDIELNVEKNETGDLSNNNESQKNNVDVSNTEIETSQKQESTKQEIVKEDNNKTNDESIPSNDNTNEDTPVIDDVPENNNTIIEEETSTPQVDQELERLKNLIKYKTSQECYEASIDVSFQYLDNENFKHTACQSFAYKGELLGYRMLIYYKDGTTEYLDAIG